MLANVKGVLTALVGLAALTLAVPAAADPAAARTTIEAQLRAFAAGDVAAAYALAAPSIQRMFPTAERFNTMVRHGYEPVTDARTPVFLRSKELDGGRFAQEVEFTDGDGQSWTALYTLARQSDGSWRIDGCYLKRADGTGA